MPAAPDQNTDTLLAGQCLGMARYCALAVVALGVAVLIGWALDIAALKSVLPGWATMRVHAAVGFVLGGASLFAASRMPQEPGGRRIQRLLAALVILLGMLTLVEYLVSAEFAMDHLLLMSARESMNGTASGRMALATTFGFIVSGSALLLIDSRRGGNLCQIAGLAGMLFGVLVILGYSHGVAALYNAGATTSVALHVAVGFVLLNLGVLLARPQRGLMAVVTSKTAGGVMARRMLPFAIIAPFVIGWLRIQGEQHGYYNTRLGLALVALTYMLLLIAFIWRTAEVLRHSDQHRFEAKRTLRKHQAQLTGIIDSAMDAIIMIDAAQRIVLFNPAAEQMFGRPSIEVLGAALDILLPQRLQAGHNEHIRAFGVTGTTNRRMGRLGALTAIRANGEEFSIEAAISQLEANGDKYYTVILRDITESMRVQEALRESEERERVRSEELSQLLDAVPAAVWFAHDPQATVITGNQLSYQWLRASEGSNVSQVAPEGEAQGNYLKLKDGLALAPAQTPLHLAAAGAEIRDYEFDFAYPDGTSRHVLGNARPLLDKDGQARGAISAFVDITARREAELAMQAAKAEAERANNGKSRFLAAASHDLRQPLSALSIYANVLKSHITPASQPLLENLKDCVASMSGLLADLLDLSKLEAGVVTPNRSNFSIAEVLARMLSVHSPEAHCKGLRLRCASSRLTAYSDPVLFARILGNLIHNAIRYTESGDVLVGCRRRQGKTWVEVWDTGIGIAADKTTEIFEEFKQLDNNARNRGSGLGLAIAAKSAALLGLEISVRSWPGRGSVFAIELPRGQDTAITAPKPAARAGVYRALRIALVEDNTNVRHALLHALQQAGHQVVAAITGEELRARLGSLAPDIVVSDYRLTQGEMGFDVIAAVRANMGADLPAIIITGDTDPKLMRSMTDRGIIVLHKPLELEMLQAYLEELTQQSTQLAMP